MKKAKFIICLLILLLTVQFNTTLGKTYKLNKTELTIDYNNEGYFKDITDIEVYKDYIFIVDNAINRVLAFKRENDKLLFQKFIAKTGQGPGDLWLPIRISIWNDLLAIQDQFGISFFDINGTFKSKFRLFSLGVSMLFINNTIYFADTNPSQSNLIIAYSMDGRKLFTFGKKFLDLDYSIHKGMNAGFLEFEAFSGLLLSDGDYIYYLSYRFGTAIKYTFSGEKVSETNITPLLGEDEKSKVKENTRLFIKKGFNLYAAKRGVPQYYIFRDAKIVGNNIFLLNDDFEFLRKAKNLLLEIKSINKDNYELLSTYQMSLS